MRRSFIATALILFSFPVAAMHGSDHLLSLEEWEVLGERVNLLEHSAFLPSLLPVVMTNRDALALSDEQVESLYNWRKENYVDMVNIMNSIIEKKVQFSIESLSVDVSREHLFDFQEEIFVLQRELLRIRMSCRDLIVMTFTPEQWESFEFIVSDNPRLASFISQANLVTLEHEH